MVRLRAIHFLDAPGPLTRGILSRSASPVHRSAPGGGIGYVARIASSADTVEVVRKLFDALNAHDLDRAYGLYLPTASHLGQPRPVHGAAEMRALDEEFFTAFPDHHREIERIVADGETVVVLLDVTGTNTGARGGAPPTGRRVRFAVCNVIELRDGRVASMRQIYDSAQIAQQLS